jgi:hypothetical protein
MPLTADPEQPKAKKPRPAIFISPTTTPNNVLLLGEDTDDKDYKRQVSNRTFDDGFMDEIKNAFSTKHHTKESIAIEKFEGGGVHKYSHFIITYDEKKWHAKPALHGIGNNLGTQFNEFAHYKLNEFLKIGPRCYGFLSKKGVLMILTEDVNDRSLKGINKIVSFSDDDLGISLRTRDKVHLFATQIAINLLSLSDLDKKPGRSSNIGFKISYEKENPNEKKVKPIIVDFTILDSNDSKSTDMKSYAESLARILEFQSEQPKNIFKFKESPEVIKMALIKLFLDDDGEIKKFENDIKKAFKESRKLLESYKIEDIENKDEDFKKPHSDGLQKQENRLLERLNIFLENNVIRDFLKEEGKKIKEEKFSKQGTESNPPTDVSPTNSSGKSIGSEDEHSPSQS